MTAATLTAVIPSREAIASLAAEAAGHRESQLEGCCWPDEPCAAHEPAAAMGWALRMTVLAIRACGTSGEALRVIRSLAPRVQAEITGATADEDMIAAIEGGTQGGQR